MWVGSSLKIFRTVKGQCLETRRSRPQETLDGFPVPVGDPDLGHAGLWLDRGEGHQKIGCRLAHARAGCVVIFLHTTQNGEHPRSASQLEQDQKSIVEDPPTFSARDAGGASASFL